MTPRKSKQHSHFLFPLWVRANRRTTVRFPTQLFRDAPHVLPCCVANAAHSESSKSGSAVLLRMRSTSCAMGCVTMTQAIARTFATTDLTTVAVRFPAPPSRAAHPNSQDRENHSCRRSFTSRCSCQSSLPRIWSRSSSSIRSAEAIVRSVALCRSVSCRANRAHCRRRGQGERGEIRFSETFGWKIFLRSAASALLYGVSTSPVLRSRSAPDAAIGKAISTSRVRRRLLTKHSWRSSTSCDHANELDMQMVSRHRRDEIASPVTCHRTVLVGVRRVCLLALDLRRACGLPLADDLRSPSAHTSEHAEPSGFCHAFAWHHHLLSDRSGALSPPFSGARHAGGVRDRGFRKGADGGSPVISAEIPAAGYTAARLAQFQSALVPAMAADTATAPDRTDPPVAVVVTYDRNAA